MEEWKGHLNPPKFDAPAQFARFLSLMHLCRAQSHVCALHQQPTIYLAQFCSEAKDHSALIVRTGALHVMMTCYTLAAMFFRLWPFMPIYMDFLFLLTMILSLTDALWFWFMLIDSDWCWLMLIDSNLWWIMQIDADAGASYSWWLHILFRVSWKNVQQFKYNFNMSLVSHCLIHLIK